ncbi:tetratricopeptide repeat protein, partial [bacterium]|nr:tetratricopeptide repeat protein [candidate division CSSED10-310 bacterium]
MRAEPFRRLLKDTRTRSEWNESLKRHPSLIEFIRSGGVPTEPPPTELDTQEASICLWDRLQWIDGFGRTVLERCREAWNLFHLTLAFSFQPALADWLRPRIERVIADFPPDGPPLVRARLLAARSCVSQHLAEANPFEYADQVLAMTREALKTDFRTLDFDLWIQLKNIECFSLLTQVRGEYSGFVEQAISIGNDVLAAIEDHNRLSTVRSIHNTLGMAYGRRPEGNRMENIEQAIHHYRLAWDAVEKDPGGTDRAASILNNLGLIYRQRIRGDKAENMEISIDYLLRALSIHMQKKKRLSIAQTLTNLGVSYCDRRMGNRKDNLHTAIRYYRRALTYFDPDRHAGYRAWTMHNLGVAYQFLPPGRNGAMQDKAIACYREALRFRTPEHTPMDWLRTIRNLSRLLCVRIRGDRQENSRLAVECLDNALETAPRETHRTEWARTHATIGYALIHRENEADAGEDLESAVRHFRTALEILLPDVLPVESREAAMWLGDTLIRLGRFDEAEDALLIAIEADTNRYQQMFISQSMKFEIESGSPIYFLMSYLQQCRGDAAGALTWLERGKARWMTERMRWDRVSFLNLPEIQRKACTELAAKLEALRIEHYIPARDVGDIIRETRSVQEQLRALIEANSRLFPAFPGKGRMETDYLTTLAPNTAVVEFNVTQHGTVIFFAVRTANGVGVRSCVNPSFTWETMHRFVSRWVARMNRLQMSPTHTEQMAWGNY